MALGKKIQCLDNHNKKTAQEKVNKKETKDLSGTQQICDKRELRVPRQEQIQGNLSMEFMFLEKEMMTIMKLMAAGTFGRSQGVIKGTSVSVRKGKTGGNSKHRWKRVLTEWEHNLVLPAGAAAP